MNNSPHGPSTHGQPPSAKPRQRLTGARFGSELSTAWALMPPLPLDRGTSRDGHGVRKKTGAHTALRGTPPPGITDTGSRAPLKTVPTTQTKNPAVRETLLVLAQSYTRDLCPLMC